MKFGYTIVYVPKVAESLAFFERAFELETAFLHESGQYGELKTGSTKIAFAAHEIAQSHLPKGYVKANESVQPLGMELALVCDDVDAAHILALSAGATELAEPTRKPWGQTVSYLRCPDGTLVELCTPMGE